MRTVSDDKPFFVWWNATRTHELRATFSRNQDSAPTSVRRASAASLLGQRLIDAPPAATAGPVRIRGRPDHSIYHGSRTIKPYSEVALRLIAKLVILF